MISVCSNCGKELGKRNISGFCRNCRVKKWHAEHKERVTEIKKKYVKNNPKKRKETVFKDNNGKGRERKANWYDMVMFSGKRTILLKTHPYCCRCGSREMLHIHHRDGNGSGKVNPNNNWGNLIVLCFACHMKVHKLKERPYYVGK